MVKMRMLIQHDTNLLERYNEAYSKNMLKRAEMQREIDLATKSSQCGLDDEQITLLLGDDGP